MSPSDSGRASSATRQGSYIGDLAGVVSEKESLNEEVPSIAEVQDKPWKFIGYKRYAEFISSDNDFFLVRRFDALSVRVALSLQDDIAVLEGQLNDLDRDHSRRTAPDVDNGTFRNDVEERRILLHKITKALTRYNDFIIQQSKIRAYQVAPKRDIKNIRRWHRNNGTAIFEEEQKYLDHKDDLICVVGKYKSPLRRAIDNSLWFRTLFLWRVDKNKAPPAPEYDADITYYSDGRIDGFVSVLIAFLGTIMLITPIWILQALDNLTMKLAVITAFVLGLLLIVSFLMVAKPLEALGATAAYAAVLMVFIQVTPG
ncbi:hypothetical protein GGR56DRAFT_661136 [Xylariaceae sp. FL0804]|nr:hypothetical protein GGR56DRAFT_661136 [Xylariaceae sp. FL0804]